MADKPSIHRTKRGTLSIKVERTIILKDAPVTETTLGEAFTPRKAVVIDFGDRASVAVMGNKLGGYGIRSTRYELHDYPNYQSCPDWLWPLIREAGYEGKIR